MNGADVGGSLGRLVEWYRAQCDGLWEHTYGINIATIDNPGFSVEIDLMGTKLEHVPFPPQEWDTNPGGEGEWFDCRKSEEATWTAACSPSMLEHVIDLFNQWAME